MREVQRLPDDVILVWYALPRGLSLAQFVALQPHEQALTLVSEFRNRVPQATVNRATAAGSLDSVKTFQPVDLPSATWHLVAFMDARQFNTPTGDLDADDVALDGNTILFKDADGTYDELPLTSVTIKRDAQNAITKVTRKGRA